MIEKLYEYIYEISFTDLPIPASHHLYPISIPSLVACRNHNLASRRTNMTDRWDNHGKIRERETHTRSSY